MNNKSFFTIEEASYIIGNNPYILIAIDKNGNIKNCVGLNKLPSSPEETDKLIKTEINKGCLVSFLEQNIENTELFLTKRIKEAIEDFNYIETHDLKAGVNIPEKDSKGIRKLWWKLKVWWMLSKVKLRRI